MVSAIVLAVTLVTGVPSQEHRYDVHCLAPRKGAELTEFDCTMNNRGIADIDPSTCLGFGIKEARAMNVKAVKGQVRATCKQYRDGSLDLEITMIPDPKSPVMEKEDTTTILPAETELKMVYDEDGVEL
jgi:hypothetical protein